MNTNLFVDDLFILLADEFILKHFQNVSKVLQYYPEVEKRRNYTVFMALIMYIFHVICLVIFLL